MKLLKILRKSCPEMILFVQIPRIMCRKPLPHAQAVIDTHICPQMVLAPKI